MSEDSAPRVFVTYSHDTERHKRDVREFATFLRSRVGLDVHLDQWADGKRQDWSLWAMEHLRESDFVLVIASPQYRLRAEGRAESHVGRGAQFEAAIIRDHLTRNLRQGTERVLPVVLPGGSIEDIPMFLAPYSTTRYEIAAYTESAVNSLISAITGESAHPMPERGPWRGGAASTPRDHPRDSLTDRERWLDHSDDIHIGSATIDGVPYSDSILLRPEEIPTARSFLELDLGRGVYRRLTAVVGIVDDAEEPFQVGRVVVVLDEKPRLEQTVVLGKPLAVDLDLTDTRRLRLEMFRPAPPASPLGKVNGGLSRRPSELAWGNPTLR
ncbi:SEFIR domain-containing protein [Actinokineospora diospyrosa]|uniref:NPCBM/NEW2 domain-containing protein n=1 Tax=Actinokineospora diospyrosa TaxID=103728 RepID=A0ABT1IA15_9PSEU|nr:SEFIR domain-containing protein [Actinokineospora diospyrosa]MCP2269419.1 NPCBM/NEW2 domain-containing protein [Actinokineospora diospyrosa]